MHKDSDADSSAVILRSDRNGGKKGMDVERLTKVADWGVRALCAIVTFLIFPAISWARTIESAQQRNTLRLDSLVDSKTDNELSGDIKSLRAEVAAMRLDLGQRLTKVETKLEPR